MRPKSDKPIEIPLSVLSGGQCQLDDEFADLIRSYWQSQCRRRLSAGRSNGEQPGSRRRQTDGKWLQRLVEVNVQLFIYANQHKIQEASVIRNNFDETLILSLHRDLPVRTVASLSASLDSGTMLIIYSCCIRVLDLFIERMVAISPTVSQLELPTIEAWNTRPCVCASP
ncbi:uncharacterized protein PG998_011790 [Apiospora kogelbergensis]|uniref:uncharacterized protein n=1 Tax=Apiospora kogelbergensis TaxID=1337665 RepID=UPI0031326B4F